MIPYEKYSDDVDYLVPGSGQGTARKIEQPAPLTIVEVFPCPGCGRGLDAQGICGECEAERELLTDLWDFQASKRVAQVRAAWNLQAVLCAGAAAVLGVYLVFEYAALIADWICGVAQ